MVEADELLRNTQMTRKHTTECGAQTLGQQCSHTN